jgi:hypothetical protein
VRVETLSAALTLAALVSACSTPGAKPGTSSDEQVSCREGCETNLWPRAIVSLLPPRGFTGDEVDLASVNGIFTGLMQEGRPHGCPPLPETLHCSYSFFANSTDESFELIVTPTEGEEFRAEVKLGAFNTCGRAVAYVTVDLDPAARSISEPRYVNPCSGL